jgi:hypothetical protein
MSITGNKIKWNLLADTGADGRIYISMKLQKVMC